MQGEGFYMDVLGQHDGGGTRRTRLLKNDAKFYAICGHDISSILRVRWWFIHRRTKSVIKVKPFKMSLQGYIVVNFMEQEMEMQHKLKVSWG